MENPLDAGSSDLEIVSNKTLPETRISDFNCTGNVKSEAPDQTSAPSPPAKRGPGRPRKIVDPNAPVPVKRKPGRPKKERREWHGDLLPPGIAPRVGTVPTLAQQARAAAMPETAPDPAVTAAVRRQLEAIYPQAMARIVELIGSGNEGVALSAAKFVIERLVAPPRVSSAGGVKVQVQNNLIESRNQGIMAIAAKAQSRAFARTTAPAPVDVEVVDVEEVGSPDL